MPDVATPETPPSGDLTLEQEAAAATVPPPAFPDNPVDAALADAQAPPAVVEPKTPVESAQQNLETAKKIGEEDVKNVEERNQLNAKLAEQRSKFVDEHAKEYSKLIAQQQLHRQAAQQEVIDARAAAENEPYHSYWESRTNGQKVAIALGQILGGVSWNPAHVNRAVTQLHDAMENDMQLQKQKHADLWRAVNEAQQGVKDLDASQLRDLSAFQATEGAKWDRVSSELGAMIAANKGKGDITTAKKEQLAAAEKATAAWENATKAAATANHMEQMDKERIERDKLLAAKKKGSGGGVTGGGSSVQAAGVKLREEIEKAQAAGTPLTGAQIERRALELKIPPVAKAGRESLKTILDRIKEGGAINRTELNVGEKDKNLILYDPQTKEPYGKAHNAREASQKGIQDTQYGDAARRVQELAQDIREHGETVSSPEDIQRRAARYANAIIGVAVVSPLGKTNESIHQEAASIGLPGTIDPEHLVSSIAKALSGFKARAELVDHKVTEMKRLRQEFRNTVPISDEEKAKYSNKKPDKGTWVSIPDRLSGKPQAKGKTEMLVDSEGKFLGSFR